MAPILFALLLPFAASAADDAIEAHAGEPTELHQLDAGDKIGLPHDLVLKANKSGTELQLKKWFSRQEHPNCVLTVQNANQLDELRLDAKESWTIAEKARRHRLLRGTTIVLSEDSSGRRMYISCDSGVDISMLKGIDFKIEAAPRENSLPEVTPAAPAAPVDEPAEGNGTPAL